MRPALLFVVLPLMLIAACSGGTPGAGGQSAGPSQAGGGRGAGRGGGGPVEVGVLTMQPQRAALTTVLPGRTVAFRIAQVRPQVSGIIQQRLFTEGANVKAGQPLYQIDPGTYRAESDRAAAAVTKAEANALTARLRNDRIVKLAESGVVSQQDRDDVVANLRQAEADLAIAKAAMQSASINLAYTRVVAPISGRTSTSEVTEGALVSANQQTPLTTIQQLNPIYVDLTQPSSDVLRLRQQFDSGVLKRATGNKARVKLQLEDGSGYPLEGTLEFTGITVSEDTGAITLRAVVPNPEGALLPGMYVRAVLEQGVTENALLVPQRAVSRSQGGEPTVLVVNNTGKVELRALKTGEAVGNDWQVLSGLNAGDRVIVEGTQKAKAGDSVKAVELAGKQS